MIRITTILLLAVLFSASSNKQNSEFPEMKKKELGGVKSIKIKIRTEEASKSKTYTFYDKKGKELANMRGLIDSISIEYYDQERTLFKHIISYWKKYKGKGYEKILFDISSRKIIEERVSYDSVDARLDMGVRVHYAQKEKLIIKYKYDKAGNLIEEELFESKELINFLKDSDGYSKDSISYKKNYVFDNKNCQIKREDYVNNELDMEYHTEYDSVGKWKSSTTYRKGKLYSTETCQYDMRGNLTISIYKLYNEDKEVSCTKDSSVYSKNNLRVFSFYYGQNCQTLTQKVIFNYDKKGNVIEQRDNNINAKVENRYITKYDKKGNEIEWIGLQNNKVYQQASHKCNEMGDKIESKIINPNGKTEVIVYTYQYEYY